MGVFEKAQRKCAEIVSAIENLRAEKEKIEAQLTRQESELLRLEGFISTYHELEEPESNYAFQEVRGLEPFKKNPVPLLKPKMVEIIAEAYLKEAAPKKTLALVSYLESRGCQIPSGRKEAYIAGILSRSEKFVARRRYGGWFLSGDDPVSKEENTSPMAGTMGEVGKNSSR